MKYSILSIFTHTGRTYTFREVDIVCDNESFLQFTYSAMSDGRSKVANFPKSNIAGWSTTALPKTI